MKFFEAAYLRHNDHPLGTSAGQDFENYEVGIAGVLVAPLGDASLAAGGAI
ncbi:MAG: hypothetical protein AAF431_19805 [Pseudomonadota bacterium]